LQITVGDTKKKIRINRIHIEEDAGKSIHDENSDYSNIDCNRAGMPLLEIVTEPDIRSAEEAAAYVTSLRKLVRHLDVCDGNMERGSLRCDVNISVRKRGDDRLGTRVEIKNLNSIRFIKKAIETENRSLIEQVENGIEIQQQTKGFNETTSTTYVIRTKEDEDDYRYFPEPDLSPFNITEEWIEKIRNQMPPAQSEIFTQLVEEYGLTEYNARIIAEDSDMAAYFFNLAKETTNYKAAANWIIGPINNHCIVNDQLFEDFTVDPKSIAELIRLIDEGKISYGIAAQQLFKQLVQEPETDIREYISINNLGLQAADETDTLIDEALKKHGGKIKAYQKGKKGLISVFVGEVMKLSKGKADAKSVTNKLIEKLKADK
ncbi:MAG TPA: Asp-tRNA(Asn)/Glu-tRNA(Gln) amidotransferase subunit GatB, partial [Flavisolibacter sp.]|nr:Asp-tRNA(Asn)/Glu-tRNA(Gln) amidotransferase subunit GatB [Flavisolibacter sp.]